MALHTIIVTTGQYGRNRYQTGLTSPLSCPIGDNGEDVYGKEQAGCGHGREGREMNLKE